MAAYVRRQTRRARAIRSMNATFRKINRAGDRRAKQICELIVEEIRLSPTTPFDTRIGENTTGPHLKYSYAVKEIPGGGGWAVATRRRYWRFVEFGTKEHGSAQPHIRPAIEAARRVYRW